MNKIQQIICTRSHQKINDDQPVRSKTTQSTHGRKQRQT